MSYLMLMTSICFAADAPEPEDNAEVEVFVGVVVVDVMVPLAGFRNLAGDCGKGFSL